MARYSINDNWGDTRAYLVDALTAWAGGDLTNLLDFKDGAALRRAVVETTGQDLDVQDWELDRFLGEVEAGTREAQDLASCGLL